MIAASLAQTRSRLVGTLPAMYESQELIEVFYRAFGVSYGVTACLVPVLVLLSRGKRVRESRYKSRDGVGARVAFGPF